MPWLTVKFHSRLTDEDEEMLLKTNNLSSLRTADCSWNSARGCAGLNSIAALKENYTHPTHRSEHHRVNCLLQHCLNNSERNLGYQTSF